MKRKLLLLFIVILIALGLRGQTIRHIGVNQYEAPKTSASIVKFPYKPCYIWRFEYKLNTICQGERITFDNKITLSDKLFDVDDSNLIKIECIPSTYHYLDEEITYLELNTYKFIVIKNVPRIEKELSPIKK